MREKRVGPVSLASPEIPSPDLGERIAWLRKRKGWNQAELAERIGIRANQISKYERGAYEPRPAVLGPLAEALGTTVDFLLTGREAKVQRDPRFRNLLPLLESLPEPLRDGLVSTLEAVVRSSHLIEVHQRRTKARQT
ncbi:MAG: helix-turn-helix domain-containing protein [Thermoanaerobaculia bacterium]